MKLLLLSLCAAGIVSAGVLQEYEGFNYADGPTIEGLNGGSGWAGGWSGFGPLAAVKNGAATTAGFQPVPTDGGFVSFWYRSFATPIGYNDTTVYASFVLRPEDGYGFYGGLNFGSFFAGLSGDESFYGLEGTSIGLSTVAAVVGQPVLLVLRFDFLDGADKVSLYVNPTSAVEPVTPDVVMTDFDLGVFNSITLNNYGGFTTDEIRIGTSFDVVAVPEPAFGIAGMMIVLASAKLARSRRRSPR